MHYWNWIPWGPWKKGKLPQYDTVHMHNDCAVCIVFLVVWVESPKNSISFVFKLKRYMFIESVNIEVIFFYKQFITSFNHFDFYNALLYIDIFVSLVNIKNIFLIKTVFY